VIALLRRSEGTVNELAAALELSDNAVRAHLASLERDGLVEQRGVRRGVGKPAYIYGLSPAAADLFPKVYDRLLAQLLDLLTERDGVAAVEALLVDAGRRVVSGRVWPEGEEARLGAALALLEELGGLAEVVEGDGVAEIRGYSCPLGELVPTHPEVCRLAESLLTEVVGAPVRERCERGDQPRCVFEVERGGRA
jgi:predicted ArsR family transcriptional regulator